MNPRGANNTNTSRIMRKSIPIKADASGQAPAEIEVLKAGVWRTLYHGEFMVTPDDLQEYVDHFNANIGLPGEGANGAPIDYKHENWDKAAGWMKSLSVQGDALIAKVKWTPAGQQAIVDEEYCYFSPQFYPKGRGGWCDPEDYEYSVDNVIDGGGLTNIPLFKGLSPVKADASGGQQDVIYIADEKPIKASKEQTMELATLRVKEVTALTEDEKTFIAQNKDQLTADEQTKFGLEVTKTDPAAAETEEEETVENVTEKQEAAVAASLKQKGFAVVKADTLQRLQDTAERYEQEAATNFVKAHAARGAIKADQINKWAERLVKADAATRKDLEDALAGLPDNEVMASAQGANTNDAGDATSIVDELKEKTLAKVTASKEAGRELSYGQAQIELLREDKDLAGRVEAARK
jgi:phage I-like protein